LSIIKGLLASGDEAKLPGCDPDAMLRLQQQQLHGAAILALFWSIGSFTEPESRLKFSSMFWQLIEDDDDNVVEVFETLPKGCCVYVFLPQFVFAFGTHTQTYIYIY
jgi:hypothetical protein